MTQRSPFYFGTESEFAILGEKAAREQFVRGLPSWCRQRFSALQSRTGKQDLFLPWGRLYVDVGQHPEWATAEATDPWMVIYLQKVGEDILSQIAKEFSEDVIISRHNVDCLSATSWGFHENYLTHYSSKKQFAEVLIPHLVTRIVYTGAGGLNIDFEKKTCQFMISPRSDYLKSLIHSGSQSNRPLFHLKDEPLCRKFGRLHLICGENLYSETAGFLKIATTALLVILTDHQKTIPICGTLLDDPLGYIRSISGDIQLKKRFKSKTFEYHRPLDIQWQYLEYVYSKIDEPFMPPWARFTCELWMQTLQKLEKGWTSVSRKLDWAIKLRLFEKKLNEWGYSFFKQSSPLELTEDQLYELLQFDLCCSQLGSTGLFNKLDNNGGLEHRVMGTPSISGTSTYQYPVMGRASVRAGAINRLSQQKQTQYRADWDAIMSSDWSEILNLKDVDRSLEKWTNRKPHISSQLIKALKII
ncbi:MAG: proteasome accessory factor PafA2 family protein [Planctomycetota bacterium]|jgi:proteasome accessory factor A